MCSLVFIHTQVSSAMRLSSHWAFLGLYFVPAATFFTTSLVVGYDLVVVPVVVD